MNFTKEQLAALERLAFNASQGAFPSERADAQIVLRALEANYKEVQSHR